MSKASEKVIAFIRQWLAIPMGLASLGYFLATGFEFALFVGIGSLGLNSAVALIRDVLEACTGVGD